MLEGKQLERFWNKVDTHSFDTKVCWEWLGVVDAHGYGRFHYNNSYDQMATRIMYGIFMGFTVPKGLHIDHLCRNPICVNPDHLEVVTPMENSHRGNCNQNTTKDYCPQGHPYDRIDTRGKRCCSICRYEAVIKWRKKIEIST